MSIASLLLGSVLSTLLQLPTDSIAINQIGYYPNAKKVIIVKDSSAQAYSIINKQTKAVVYNSQLTTPKSYQPSKESVRVAEFTDFRTPGTYCLVTKNVDTSASFTIAPNLYSTALNALMKSYYYQRASLRLDQQYASTWSRNAGHFDTACTVLGTTASQTTYNVKGGWYDAGDYGKYIVCAGITCGTLLSIYEMQPDALSDGKLTIPESTNGKSDLLDEIKYELDWMLRMQDSDGGVFFKVGPIVWPGAILPEDDFGKRYIIGKSTTSTFDFASVMAMAGRLYRTYDSSFASSCIKASEKAWDWALQNPKVGHPTDTRGTGPYEDGTDLSYNDEKLWASSELYISTGKTVYKDTLNRLITSLSISGPAWWQDVKDLAFYSLSQHRELLSDSLYSSIKKAITSAADKLCETLQTSAFRTSMTLDNYTWGSAGNAGNQAVLLAYAHYLTREQKYIDCLVMQCDFLFGRNPTGYSFATGLGIRSPMNVHHRPSQADLIVAPVPGLVVGGPNQFVSGADPVLTAIIKAGTPAAKCYIDNEESYASNEVAINQNAPWVFALAYLEKYADSSVASPVKRQYVDNTGRLDQSISISAPDGRILTLFYKRTNSPILTITKCNGQIVKTVRCDNKQSYSSVFNGISNGTYFLSVNKGNTVRIVIDR